MDSSELAALFFGDDESGPEKAQALAQALRGQQQLGQLGLLSGDKVLSGVGKGLLENAGEMQAAIPKAAQMRLSKALEAEKARREQEFQQAQMKHMAAQDTGEAAYRQAQQRHLSAEDRHLAAEDAKLAAAAARAGESNGLTANQEEQEWQKFAESVSSTRGRSNLAREYQRRLDAAKQLERLLKTKEGALIAATPQQVREASTALAKLISSGNLSEHQIEELTPDTLAGKWANFKQQVLNKPQSAEAQGFLQNMLETSGREQEVAMEQLRNAQHQAIPAYAPLRKRDAARFESVLRGVGIDPNTIDENGLRKAVEKASGGSGGSGGAGEPMVKMRSPKGQLVEVPKSRVDAAIKAGGKLVE